MANEKTKAQALKDLGEKVTGKTLTSDNTIVGMLDQITDNYSGGSGSGANSYILQGNVTWMSGEAVEITDEENLAQLNGFKNAIARGEKPAIGFKLQSTQYEDPIYYVLQTKVDYLATSYGDRGDSLKVQGIGFLNVVGMTNTFIKVDIIYGWQQDSYERQWKITLTALNQG